MASPGHRALDWLLRDRTTGRWTVVQRPNLPLVLFLALRLASIVVSGRAGSVLQWAGTVALAWWAVDETARGVNPLRRMLGGVVLAAIALGTVRALL